jgi:hypothetical protein
MSESSVNEHIFETIGLSTSNKCDGHVWQGENGCPYCADAELNSQRNKQITKMALQILEANLKEYTK